MTVIGFVRTPEPTKNRGNSGFCDTGNQGRIMTLKKRQQTQNPSNCGRLPHRRRPWMSPSEGDQVEFDRLLSWGGNWTFRHIEKDILQRHTLCLDDWTVRIHACVWENYLWLSKRATRGLEGMMFDTETWRWSCLSSSGPYNTLSSEETSERSWLHGGVDLF